MASESTSLDEVISNLDERSFEEAGGIVAIDASDTRSKKVLTWDAKEEAKFESYSRVLPQEGKSKTKRLVDDKHAKLLLTRVLPLVEHTHPRLPRALTPLYVFLFDKEKWNDAVLPENVLEILNATRKQLSEELSEHGNLGVAVETERYNDGYPVKRAGDWKHKSLFHIPGDKKLYYQEDGNTFQFTTEKRYTRSTLPLEPPIELGGELFPRAVVKMQSELKDKRVARLLYSGYAAISLLLRRAIKQNADGTLWKREHTVEKEYAKAYAWLLLSIESEMTRFKVRSLRFAFLYSEQTMLPYSRNIIPQSIYTMSLRLHGKHRVYCTACPDGYSVADTKENYVAGNLQFEYVDPNYVETKNMPNRSGQCVIAFRELLLKQGLTEKDLNNPAWVNWIGTWQQAERRLEKFRADSDTLYTRGQFDWAEYLKNWFLLKLDVSIKWFAGLSDSMTSEERKEKIEMEQQRANELRDQWENFDNLSLLEKVKVSYAKITSSTPAKILKKLGQAGLLLVWKLVEWLFRSPMFILAVERIINDIKLKLCAKFSTRTLRSTAADAETLEELDIMTGEWSQLSEEDQLKVLAKDKLVRRKRQQDAFLMLKEIAQSLPQELSGGLQKWFDGGMFLSSLNYVLENTYLAMIFQPVLTAFGGTVALGAYLQGILLKSGFEATKEFESLTQLTSNVVRTYQMFSSTFDCSSTQLITLDGRALGADVLLDVGKDLNVAYEIMMENVPFYTIELLATYPQTKSIGDAKAWDLHVSNYLRTTFVENHRGTTTLEEQADRSKAKRFLEKANADKLESFKVLISIMEGSEKKKYEWSLRNTGEVSKLYEAAKAAKRYAAGTLTNKNLRTSAKFLAGSLLAGASYLAGKENVQKAVEFLGKGGTVALGTTTVLGGAALFDKVATKGDVISGAVYSLYDVLSTTTSNLEPGIRDQSFRDELMRFKNIFGATEYTEPTETVLLAVNDRLFKLRAQDLTINYRDAYIFDLNKTLSFLEEEQAGKCFYYGQDLQYAYAPQKRVTPGSALYNDRAQLRT